jgi:hypothetical protein
MSVRVHIQRPACAHLRSPASLCSLVPVLLSLACASQKQAMLLLSRGLLLSRVSVPSSPCDCVGVCGPVAGAFLCCRVALPQGQASASQGLRPQVALRPPGFEVTGVLLLLAAVSAAARGTSRRERERMMPAPDHFVSRMEGQREARCSSCDGAQALLGTCT